MLYYTVIPENVFPGKSTVLEALINSYKILILLLLSLV